MAEIDLAPLPGEPVPSPRPPVRGAVPAATPKKTFRAWWARFPSTPMLWAMLLLLTATGAFLRFWRLDFQAYWTDEAHTVDRIQGSYHNMLHDVGGQLFPPGWYSSLRWWCELWATHFTHTGMSATAAAGLSYGPWVTRSLAALFGTLTVPAMYFLARQFTDRKGSLLVMLLAAVNPFLIYYSRDIKMYSGVFLFVTLNSAIFFKWMTSQKHVLWMPLYVATGFCMLAIDFVGGFMLGLHAIYLLTRPRAKAWDAALWILAIGLIAWFPYYWRTNYMPDQTVQRALEGQGDAHLGWITRYTDMNWHTVEGLPTAHLLGYLWPEYPPTPKISDWFDLDYSRNTRPGDPPKQFDGTGSPEFMYHAATRTWPWMARWQLYAAYALYAVLLLGLIPWRGFRKDPERLTSVTRHRWWWVALWIAVPMIYFASTWIEPDSPWYDYVWDFWVRFLHHSAPPPKLWEPRYLGFIVPAWLLWLAASCRRLPFWPVRTLVILFFTGVCTFSALSNHLIYRNAPFNRVGAAVVRYYDPNAKNDMAVAVPAVAFQSPAMEANLDAARKIIPSSAPNAARAFEWNVLRTPSQDLSWVLSQRASASTKTILLVDRDGDDVDPRISDAALAKALGPQWHLIDEEKFQWHYEWRFYIFHTWRLRVWQRTP